MQGSALSVKRSKKPVKRRARIPECLYK